MFSLNLGFPFVYFFAFCQLAIKRRWWRWWRRWFCLCVF